MTAAWTDRERRFQSGLDTISQLHDCAGYTLRCVECMKPWPCPSLTAVWDAYATGVATTGEEEP